MGGAENAAGRAPSVLGRGRCLTVSAPPCGPPTDARAELLPWPARNTRSKLSPQPSQTATSGGGLRGRASSRPLGPRAEGRGPRAEGRGLVASGAGGRRRNSAGRRLGRGSSTRSRSGSSWWWARGAVGWKSEPHLARRSRGRPAYRAPTGCELPIAFDLAAPLGAIPL
jgi:hypothetical protein